MSYCNTNCVEKPVAAAFKVLGRCIGKYPWLFFILPLMISCGLGGGFYFLHQREVHNIEDQFTPLNGPAKEERAFVKQHFPPGKDFSQLKLYTEGVYASFILVKKPNILTVKAFQEIMTLDERVKSLKTSTNKTFENLCAKKKNKCVSNDVLDIVTYKASNIDNMTIYYPFHGKTFFGTVIGGVKYRPETKEIQSADAIRLFYYLEEDLGNETDAWLSLFIDTFSSETKYAEWGSISIFTSLSREEELKKNSKSVTPLFSITYFLAINISILSCLRLDCVRNKVSVACFGVFSAGLSVLSSFGLLLYCGMPFAITVTTSPFLILGIGVDDMFIMISCWQKTRVHDKVEDRMAETYKEAAVSITITTLTDALAFYIGLLTPFRSVQSFCMYTGTAILFCYIYNITFFGAFLALNGRREGSNRHWLTFRKVETPNPDNKGNACSVGGAYDHQTGAEEEMPINVFFKKYYGPFLTKRYTKVFVILLYFVYVGVSMYGCFQMKEGIDLKNLATDDSYVVNYYDNENQYFKDFGPFVMVIIKDKTFEYWNKTAQDNLMGCVRQFANSDMVPKNVTISWLDAFVEYGKGTGYDFSDQKTFMSFLPSFLKLSGFSEDVDIQDGVIQASRIFIPTVNVRTAVDEKNMLSFFRDTASKCGESANGVNLMVYHPTFIYFDQYAVIVSNTIQNIIVATVAMLVIALLLIPHPLCSLWVTFAIASVIAGVAGFMALWDVNLDSISMINLVICIGFSVDFSAHISYAFVSSEKRTANGKAIDALYNLGYPIIQGALSTIAGVIVLSAAKSYIFRTFFKIMFLVISFGAVHGLVFIPVFLTFFGVCGKKVRTESDKSITNNIELKKMNDTLEPDQNGILKNDTDFDI
ncbi:patched domain-containing protein 3-like [Alosa sapidissima]|uniref:patched domain-containing protein 3-like n=1 Tax=Alosa sapidissima TaxID=34773 RepID=UPI001C09FF34|nr:patched domain-containing protein 3-like [Alosa sapidissima]